MAKVKLIVPKEFKKARVLGVWIENEEVIEIDETLKADFIKLGFVEKKDFEDIKRKKKEGI